MELDYKLSKQQKEQLATFARLMGDQTSWVLSRLQGTGLRFWRITWANAPEWGGDTRSTDGKTLLEAINLTLMARERQPR